MQGKQARAGLPVNAVKAARAGLPVNAVKAARAGLPVNAVKAARAGLPVCIQVTDKQRFAIDGRLHRVRREKLV